MTRPEKNSACRAKRVSWRTAFAPKNVYDYELSILGGDGKNYVRRCSVARYERRKRGNRDGRERLCKGVNEHEASSACMVLTCNARR